uniref:Transmembrane protein 157 n=1 Tax=Salvator merianae TaxID=96440 RepID=A0A8D0C9P8_SALMN
MRRRWLRRLLVTLPPGLRLLMVLLLVGALCEEGGGEPVLAPTVARVKPQTGPAPLASLQAPRHDEVAAAAPHTNSSRPAAARNNSTSHGGPPVPRDNEPKTQRALSVLVLASAALIIYFVIRTVRLRRRNRKTRRYGVLDTNIENTELTPLEQDDDDDDTTLFDANHPRRLVVRIKDFLFVVRRKKF